MEPQDVQGREASERMVEQIRRAFADVPQPEPALLVNNHCCECLEVSTALGGRAWQEISLEDLRRAQEMSLLSPAAWRYYLPAMLTWAIREPLVMDVMVDNLVYQLEPPRDGHGVPEWFAERSVGFTRDQRAAIVVFLEWYRQLTEADWAGTGVPPPPHVYHAIAHWLADPDA